MEIRNYSLDHHGLVAATCDDLKLCDRIDQLIGSKDSRRVVQPGNAVKAMIINGLGFMRRPLYLTSEFFKNKPVELLFGEGITAQDLNEYTLGKALEEIYEYGPTEFFAQIAFGIARDHGLLGKKAHLDSTSFSMQGVYDLANENPFIEPVAEDSKTSSKDGNSGSGNGETVKTREPIDITYGHSKDKRPDLKQVMIGMVMNGPANLPIWAEGQDGNSSDKTSFQKTINAIQAFQKSLNRDDSFMWIADSALYSKDSILKIQNHIWITRVPETLNECCKVVDRTVEDSEWTTLGNGYKFYQTHSDYGDISQRWLIVFSQQAYEREVHTLNKAIKKEEDKAIKACNRLKGKNFACSDDAKEHLKALSKGYKYHTIEGQVVEMFKHEGKGRPKKDAIAKTIGYCIEAKPSISAEKKNQVLNRKGKFVLATNELDEEKLLTEDILNNYKEQQSVEQGFRFLKEPVFMADTFFLKNPKRIEALMVVMCLCLLVYNFAQYRLRKALEDQNETLPNQKKKEIKNPTMRWIFDLMTGTILTEIFDNTINDWKSYVTNLDPVKKRIINLFGKTAKVIYKIE